jgi:hypothetical protein
MKTWKICLFAMFLLGICIGVFLCVVGIRLFQCHLFWIIDSRWLVNLSIGREGPLVFLLKVWIHLLECMGFYTIGLLESACETFMDMKNPARDETVHKNDMSKFIEDTNQGTPAKGDPCSFPSFANIGVPLMAMLNIHGLNVGLLI